MRYLGLQAERCAVLQGLRDRALFLATARGGQGGGAMVDDGKVGVLGVSVRVGLGVSVRGGDWMGGGGIVLGGVLVRNDVVGVVMHRMCMCRYVYDVIHTHTSKKIHSTKNSHTYPPTHTTHTHRWCV